ncbi:chromate transporter [Mycoplasma sp. P36-A1]|uniref:chromate transporter n=1 Tax=Mycoplasma sp. P36-A1 TaxID=3252900 RepID=UPI003C2B14ED
MEEKKPFDSYFQLFKETFILSAFTFGGGYVIIAMMKKRFVEQLKWIDNDEMLDLVTIAQSAPGVMAVNTSIILGRKLGGFKGSLVATLGTILPPFIILGIISLFYKAFVSNFYVASVLQGMQAGVAAVILIAAITMFNDMNTVNKTYNIIMSLAAFFLSYFMNINVIYLLIAALIISLIMEYIRYIKRRNI